MTLQSLKVKSVGSGDGKPSVESTVSWRLQVGDIK